MIINSRDEQTIGLTNDRMTVELNVKDALSLLSWRHRGLDSVAELSGAEKELFEIEVEGVELQSSRFIIQSVETGADTTQEYIGIALASPEQDITAKVCFVGNTDDSISFIVQLAANWNAQGPKEVYAKFPFFANFKAGGGGNVYYFPFNPVSKQNGSSIVQMIEDFPMPLGIFTGDGQKGFSVRFPTFSESWFVWSQNRNIDFIRLENVEQLRNQRILVRPDEVLSDIVEFRFSAVDDGWIGFFDGWRKEMRESINFSEYERTDLRWYRDLFLQHFTYLFSKEVFDYNAGRIDLDRLLAQGQDFGGYDAVILWHQYPRLGVDARNQWDFFNDFPGGKAGLRQLVDELHSRDIKVFVPFKPWDTGEDESPNDAVQSVAELIRETDIDGLFLDTMNSVPRGFRDKIDEIKTGFVFCSEMHPSRKANLEVVTGSWDQYWNSESMPEIDLLRYVMPEHASPIIARWHLGNRKDKLIQRAIFNGVGIVIWQDIFGTWLPYNEQQKEDIRRWKQIWLRHRENYQGAKPIPLYPTLRAGLLCNCFPSDKGDSVIYSLYNDSDEPMEGLLIEHFAGKVAQAEELWGDNRWCIQPGSEKDSLCGVVYPRQISILKVT